jgi:hypothetical protein
MAISMDARLTHLTVVSSTLVQTACLRMNAVLALALLLTSTTALADPPPPEAQAPAPTSAAATDAGKARDEVNAFLDAWVAAQNRGDADGDFAMYDPRAFVGVSRRRQGCRGS